MSCHGKAFLNNPTIVNWSILENVGLGLVEQPSVLKVIGWKQLSTN